MRSTSPLTFVFPLIATVAMGCGVPQTQYDATVDGARRAKTACDATVAAKDQEIAALQAKVADLQAKVTDAEGKAGAASDATRAELDELRRQKAAAEARLKLFEDFLAKFRKMIEAGKLDITVRRGQIVLALGTDILFDTGKTEIKPDGKAALSEVADVLKVVSGRRFQVAGHTDIVPIKTKEFASNWELSSARSLAVIRMLLEKGVRPDALSAAAYAEFDPAQNNASDKGRAKNRRIEIVIVPNIEDLVKMPELGSKKDPNAAGKEAPLKPPPPPLPKP
jgi:chemotaxis protein MotB